MSGILPVGSQGDRALDGLACRVARRTRQPQLVRSACRAVVRRHRHRRKRRTARVERDDASAVEQRGGREVRDGSAHQHLREAGRRSALHGLAHLAASTAGLGDGVAWATSAVPASACRGQRYQDACKESGHRVLLLSVLLTVTPSARMGFARRTRRLPSSSSHVRQSGCKTGGVRVHGIHAHHHQRADRQGSRSKVEGHLGRASSLGWGRCRVADAPARMAVGSSTTYWHSLVVLPVADDIALLVLEKLEVTVKCAGLPGTALQRQPDGNTAGRREHERGNPWQLGELPGQTGAGKGI